ncbi:hypothetical protein [Hymenobacter coccineus]|uniref:Uncharacterized protein n=1 Tax=Hymenobacter coccineus TaxID=1908235 RepID=A0A1G1THX2_9BACT|nr:hypothetical protein [Hymenobacter coccineus]OGX90481.1 hypothetical protein BEN49_22665 [Hymenobacter coccineus]
MPHFLPDAKSITEFCGAYEQRGCTFKVVRASYLGGYGLQIHLGENSSIIPMLPLPAGEMGSPEAAQRWMEYLRDEHLSKFAFLLQGQ